VRSVSFLLDMRNKWLVENADARPPPRTPRSTGVVELAAGPQSSPSPSPSHRRTTPPTMDSLSDLLLSINEKLEADSALREVRVVTRTG